MEHKQEPGGSAGLLSKQRKWLRGVRTSRPVFRDTGGDELHGEIAPWTRAVVDQLGATPGASAARDNRHVRTIAGALLIASTAAASQFAPARRMDGAVPPLTSALVVGWLEETTELTVDERGSVRSARLLRGTASSPNVLGRTVRTWTFRPAALDRHPVNSHVLAIAMIRPPQMFDGPTLGTEAATVAAPSEDVPYPTATQRPRYPPLAVGDAFVLVEVLVASDGRVRKADIMEGTAGFDEEALAAAGQWEFRPARRDGVLVSAYVYIAFGFRQPVSGGQPRAVRLN
jgi:TonB family protein